MFQKLGQFVTQRRGIILIGWLVALFTVLALAPKWADVIEDGEFQFLPADVESKVAERLFEEIFPDGDLLASSVVIVAHRSNGKLRQQDTDFIELDLTPRIDKVIQTRDEYQEALAEAEVAAEVEKNEAEAGVAKDAGGSLGESVSQVSSSPTDAKTEEPAKELEEPVVDSITNFTSKTIGDKLISADEKASIVLVKLTSDFTDGRNDEVVKTIEEVIESIKTEQQVVETEDGKSKTRPLIPGGLQLEISGTATVGRDMRRAQRDSAKSTERYTGLLVLFLLIVIYRAPLLAIIPLITVAVATHISLKLLSLLSLTGYVGLFNGIETYVTVLVYGAGVDYCLFLIARYKEELDLGATMDEALENALGKVGHALVASAATVMCGIGMLMFAQFGKFQEAGFAITFGLAIVLLASLTFTPALIRICGRWAFWPNVHSERIKAGSEWLSPTNLASKIGSRGLLESGWDRIGQLIMKRPGLIWTLSVLCMLPFAILAINQRDNLSYGLLSELQVTEPSVRGARAVQQHFPAGEVSPLSVLIKSDHIDFDDEKNNSLVQTLTESLIERSEELGLAEVRSLVAPLGVIEDTKPKQVAKKDDDSPGGFYGILKRGGKKTVLRNLFIGDTDTKVMRFDFVFEEDPFSSDAIDNLNRFREELPKLLPDELEDAQLSYVGATPQLRDLKIVTNSDQIRIDILVLAGVFLILVVLLKRPAICAYLIISVFFSYLATLGVTYAVFWAMDPSGFAGLDWKVPMFLFTILIAVGEDYNIFLMTRIEEEQEEHGTMEGISVALKKTGSIISSCGIIMAGTFSSLLAGSLTGMHQLGFALAFGVLLDTFIVRPVLVPAYLVLLHSGRFGPLTGFLGGTKKPAAN